MQLSVFTLYLLLPLLLLAPFSNGDDSSAEVLSWSSINVELKRTGRRVLQLTAPGNIYRGRLTGLLGPSGCGKSTLLNLLAGRLGGGLGGTGPLKIVSDVSPFYFGSDVAFVSQDDAFFSMLTVMETLRLTANLRLLNRTSDDRDRAISDVLHAMALTTVEDSAVGDAAGTRGISGGERKRLSVACELLSKPRLLVADECTSGLDSYQALSVVQQLKNTVVRLDIAGVLSLHQPRSSIWALLDDIVLLAANGRCVYHGSREAASTYFARLGYACPPDTNPAEHLIDLVSVDYTSTESTLASKRRIDILVKEYADSHSLMTIKQTAEGAGVRGVGYHGQHDNTNVDVQLIKKFTSATSRAVKRFFWLLQRAVRQVVRDNGTNVVRIGVSGVLAFIVSSVYGRQSSGLIDEDSVGDRVTIIAQAAIQVSMLAMLKTLQLFKRERTVVSREIATHQYTSLEYLLSKSFAELPMDALVAAFFGLTLHELTNLRCNRFDFVSTLSLLGCASSSLGLAISALSPTGDIALAFGPALMVVYVITGSIGPGRAKTGASWLLQTLRSASPIRPACEALCVAEFKGQPFAVPNPTKRGFKSLLTNIGRMVQFVFQRTSRHSRDCVPGDVVLNDLALSDASLADSKNSLIKMVAIHSVCALVGLIMSNNLNQP